MHNTLILFLILLSYSVCSQTDKYTLESLSARESVQFGDRFLSESSYYKASEMYRQALQKDSSVTFLYRRYALLHCALSEYYLKNYSEAVRLFGLFFRTPPSTRLKEKDIAVEESLYFTTARYYYGKSLMQLGDYSSASTELLTFLSAQPSSNSDVYLLQHARVLIEGCKLGLEDKTREYLKVQSLEGDVNGPYNEYSPVELPSAGVNQLVFGSSPAQNADYYKDYKNKVIYHLNISQPNGSTWLSPTAIPEKDVNDPLVSACHVSFNRDYTRAYFTKCLEMDDDRPLCNLFMAELKDGVFGKVSRLPIPVNSNERFSSSMPTVRSLSVDSDVIYYVSARPTGKGGGDIWMTIRDSMNRYSAPVLLRGGMNTPFEEMSPYWDDSVKALYFATDGKPGYGGFDIFYSPSVSIDSFGPAIHLGSPINSAMDESYLYFDRTHTYGYLTSNRQGVKTFSQLFSAADDIFKFEPLQFAVEGNFIAKYNNNDVNLSGATFKLFKKSLTGDRILVSTDSKAEQISGRFFFDLDPNTDYEIEASRDGFETVSTAVSTKGLYEEDTLQASLITRKVDFILAGYVVEKGSQPEKRLTDFSIQIAEAVNTAGELSLLGGYTEKAELFAFPVRVGKNYRLTVEKAGYITSGADFDLRSNNPQSDTIFIMIPLDILEYNRPYGLGNIQYAFNQSKLLPESKKVLDSLVQLLKDNPTFHIELGSHTDALGSDAYNMKLSLARAKSCVNYLISKGISRKRLKSAGYGESRPKLPNTTADGKDDPAARAVNRRTEFTIIKP